MLTNYGNKVRLRAKARRPEYEVIVFTDDKERFARLMGREHEVHTALRFEYSGVLIDNSQAKNLHREFEAAVSVT